VQYYGIRQKKAEKGRKRQKKADKKQKQKKKQTE